MMVPRPQPPDGDEALSPRERARVKHRDRKRRTAMVVDNAGVKRVGQALAERRRRGAAEPPPRRGGAS
jgi:hypothetical protein